MRLLSYGNLVAKARTDAGLTQMALAHDIRIKRETVSRWERDHLKITPSAEEMHRLCDVLPELTEEQLLLSLGYRLKPRQLLLTQAEEELIEDLRRLPAVLRRAIPVQVKALGPQLQALLDGEPSADRPPQ